MYLSDLAALSSLLISNQARRVVFLFFEVFKWPILLENYCLFILFMYSEVLNTWISTMDIEFKESSHTLRCCYEPGVHKLLYLISFLGGLKSNRYHIRSFVDILVQILAWLHTTAYFDIDVGIIFCWEVWVIWNNIFVIQQDTWLVNTSICVSPPIVWDIHLDLHMFHWHSPLEIVLNSCHLSYMGILD